MWSAKRKSRPASCIQQQTHSDPPSRQPHTAAPTMTERHNTQPHKSDKMIQERGRERRRSANPEGSVVEGGRVLSG